MKLWDFTIGFHFPHERFAIGWEFIPSEPDEFPYCTFTLYLGIVTLTLNIWT